MSDKNYIEYRLPIHEITENKRGKWEDEDELVWFAVRPSPEKGRHRKFNSETGEWGEWENFDGYYNSWRINGELHIYSKQDVQALRGLLDLIEAELPDEV